MDLGKLEPWFFLVIGLMWLLPLVGVGTGVWGGWLATISVVLIGVGKLMAQK